MFFSLLSSYTGFIIILNQPLSLTIGIREFNIWLGIHFYYKCWIFIIIFVPKHDIFFYSIFFSVFLENFIQGPRVLNGHLMMLSTLLVLCVHRWIHCHCQLKEYAPLFCYQCCWRKAEVGGWMGPNLFIETGRWENSLEVRKILLKDSVLLHLSCSNGLCCRCDHAHLDPDLRTQLLDSI